MRHNCATQVLTQTHNILKAGDLCHHALMMCWSVRNKKGSRTLSTWTQIQTAHTKLSTSSLCVFEATQTLWGFFPPSSSVINTSSSEYHTSKKKTRNSLKQTAHTSWDQMCFFSWRLPGLKRRRCERVSDTVQPSWQAAQTNSWHLPTQPTEVQISFNSLRGRDVGWKLRVGTKAGEHLAACYRVSAAFSNVMSTTVSDRCWWWFKLCHKTLWLWLGLIFSSNVIRLGKPPIFKVVFAILRLH